MQNRYAFRFTVLAVLCIAFLCIDMLSGSVAVGWSDLLATINGTTDGIRREIILNLRLPRVLTAIVAGVGLSVAGLIMQTLFRNPLAGPYILGVSSGATLGVAAVIMSSTWLGLSIPGEWTAIIAAVIGASLVLLLVLGVSFKIRDTVSLLIVGIMIGNIAGALVSVMQNYSNPDALKLFIVWTFGSLSSVTWTQMQILLCMVIPGLIIAFGLMKNLNGLLLSENYARSLGISIPRTRLLIIIATGLLAGGITAFTGPIAFIGVAVPHIARGIFNTSNHRIVMPATALCGAALMLACDALSQIGAHALPISTVCALFGAPVIIWIILKGKQE